jgi:hypothetical protein
MEFGENTRETAISIPSEHSILSVIYLPALEVEWNFTYAIFLATSDALSYVV